VTGSLPSSLVALDHGTDPVAERIGNLLDVLERTDLRPGPVVDAAFADLVALACALAPGHPVLRDACLLARSRDVGARGESLLEEHWAAAVSTGLARVTDFPYWDHYRLLVAAEQRALATISGRAARPRRLVVAGCGPLPLTGLLLAAGDPTVDVVLLDDDPTAAGMARDVVARCAAGRITVVRADAGTWDYRDTDVVMLAALAGRTDGDKCRLLARIGATLPTGGTVAARSVPPDGRLLLYRRLERGDVPASLRMMAEHRPPHGVINSVVFLRRAGRP
jgi:hypothetical protein